MLQEYVSNTHAVTHSQYSLEVLEVFKVDREGEGKKYKPFSKLHNRQLLWHGSRKTNFVGILSQVCGNTCVCVQLASVSMSTCVLKLSTVMACGF